MSDIKKKEEYLVDFILNQNHLLIQSNIKDKMEDIIDRYASKGELDKNSFIFLYQGGILKEELTLQQILSINNTNADRIQILVYEKYAYSKFIEKNKDKDIIIKSKNIICPKCKEDIMIKIKDYKIDLYDCKNGHKINNILLEEFTKTQEINLSKIICNSCNQNNKALSFNHEFYYCINCKNNLCPLCMNNHDKKHIVINNKQKNLICYLHHDSFIKYCKDCKLNLCLLCFNQHKNHNVESFDDKDIIPDTVKIREEIENLRKALNKFQENINEIIKKLNNVKDNLNIYYNIYKDIFDNFINFDANKRNYETYQNVNEIKNNIINEINDINEETHIDKQILKIMNIYNKMNNKGVNNNNFPPKIITCEKCYNIPKITLLLNNKVKIECLKCQSSFIKDISYFDKFRETDLYNLPECTFIKGHDKKAIKYCMNCQKYLCEECIELHYISFKEMHILLEERVDTEIYCKKEEHNNSKFNRYCLQCQKYLCLLCKCEHEKDSQNYYYLNNSDNEKKIKIINDKIFDCEKIIQKEEKKLNNILETINHKNEIMKNMFNNYKERNLKAISLYKLLMNNYHNTKPIKNYNLENNIILNDNIDLTNSDFSLKLQYENDECLSSVYNKLCNFYINKIHITSKQYSEFFITKKFCNKNIKKCILLDNDIIIFIFEVGINFGCLDKNDKNDFQIKEISCSFAIKDIYPLKNKNFIFMDYTKNLYVLKLNDNKFSIIQTIDNADFVINDLYNEENFFVIKNSYDFLSIIYYYKNEEKTDNNLYEDSFVYNKQKKLFSIQNLFDEINKLIDNSEVKLKHKEKLKNLFKSKKNYSFEYEFLSSLDTVLLEFIGTKIKKLYHKIKNNIEKENSKEEKENKNNIIINTNYILYKFKSFEIKEGILEIKINYVLNLENLINDIRNKYIEFLAINTKIYNVYNFNNDTLIFISAKYLFIEYELKTKKFNFPLYPDFLLIEETDYKYLEIKHIYSNIIILNNTYKKTFFLLEKNDDIYLIKDKYNYHSNILENNNYLLFDTIKDDKLEYNAIHLSSNSFLENNIYKEIFNFKISYNIPKILSINNYNKFLFLYENNQISIVDYHSLDKAEILNYIDNYQKNNNNLITKCISTIQKNIEEIIIKKKGALIPEIIKFSDAYSSSYEPKYLFTKDENYYYCSLDNSEHFIHFDFSKEYNFSYAKVIFLFDNSLINCIPKIFSVELYNNDYKLSNVLQFKCKNDKAFEIIFLRDKARYIHFIFKKNFGGDYFIIKKIEFYDLDNI